MDADIDIGWSFDSTRNTLGVFELVPTNGTEVVPSIVVANLNVGETTRERRTITRGWIEPLLGGGATEKANSAAMRAALGGAVDAAGVSIPGGAAATDASGRRGTRGELAVWELGVDKD